ncbi:MAG TPA: tetratricopeptide repeat protein [Burkholderiales bacterium]|nr:tetratricopeptide repeat protein [Burkholderiales bacterium]
MARRNTPHGTRTGSLPPARHIAQEAARLLAAGQVRRALEIARRSIAADVNSAELCLVAGVCAASLGDDDQAQQLWREAIALDPRSAQAHFNLGRLHSQRKNYGEAERCYREAIALQPRNAGAHGNLAILLLRRQAYDEAEQSYRAALDLDPGNADLHANFGAMLAARKRDDAAESHYRRAIALDPSNAPAYSNLGASLANRKRYDEAEQCYRKALALEPGHAGAHCNLGILLAARKQRDEAERMYRRAIELAPASADAYTNLGLLLDACDRDEEAETLHRQALALAPESSAIWTNLANLLVKLGRNEEAEQSYRRAIMLDPTSPIAQTNLGALLADSRRADEAEEAFGQAIALAPDYPRAQLNLGYLLLAQGRLAEGWRLHELRFHEGLADRATHPPDLPFPQWQGESLSGKSLLIWPEQGFGDEIQFCRFVPLLKQRGARELTLVCKPPLETLMKTLDGVDRVLNLDNAAVAVPPHDYWAFPLSLPFRLGIELETIPAKTPYLRALPERIAQWASRLPRGGLRVGLVWQGNHRNPNDADRSLRNLSVLAPLWSVSAVQFVSLQKGPAEDQAREPPAGQPLVHLGSDIADFADAAAIVQQLDLLICVDTATAHLAGALAKPCWVLLPAHKTDWRWLQARADSPWYPTMRLFRQRARGEWEPVIGEVAGALRDLADSRCTPSHTG